MITLAPSEENDELINPCNTLHMISDFAHVSNHQVITIQQIIVPLSGLKHENVHVRGVTSPLLNRSNPNPLRSHQKAFYCMQIRIQNCKKAENPTLDPDPGLGIITPLVHVSACPAETQCA